MSGICAELQNILRAEMCRFATLRTFTPENTAGSLLDPVFAQLPPFFFLMSSPSYKTVSCSSSYKTKTEQKPSGDTAPALSWKTSRGTRALPRLHPATGRPLSRSDRTGRCWHRNMKRLSLEALWLSAPVWTGCGLSRGQYQTSAWRLNAAKRKAFRLIH